MERGGTFFGEALHLHSLQYEDVDWFNPSSGSPHPPLDSETPNVILYDWHQGDDGWADWDDFMEFTDVFDLPRAPVLYTGSPDEAEFEIPDESFLGGPPEGIVVRRLDGSVRAKKVTDDFKERNATTFNDPSKAQTEAGEFVAQFITDARISKQAQKLIDEGEYDELRMEMMEDLPREVIRDALSEEAWSLMCHQHRFECEFDEDFKSEVRSKASSKCARVLKTELNSLSM